MSFVAALGGNMEDVTRVRFVSIQPVRDVLAEPTADLRIEPNDIVFSQRLQTRLSPFSHRYHDRVLIHFESRRFIELQASLPRVSKPIRPFPRMTILLVPDEFLCPQPSLFSHSEN